MKKDSNYLNHILDSISKIDDFTEGISKSDFKDNELVQSAVIRQIEIIGEATKQLSNRIRDKYPHIPWKDMAGMRDKLIHDYFGIDLNSVWDTITNSLPSLTEKIEKVITSEKQNDG